MPYNSTERLTPGFRGSGEPINRVPRADLAGLCPGGTEKPAPWRKSPFSSSLPYPDAGGAIDSRRRVSEINYTRDGRLTRLR